MTWKSEKLLSKILSVRCEQPAKKRPKKTTAINTEATHRSQLISLSESGICEPALTEDFSDQELQDALLNDTKPDLPELPSHSQSVERAVKLTSEASHSVYCNGPNIALPHLLYQ